MTEIIEVDTSELKLLDRNARKHPERSITSKMNDLKRFGQQKPIVVDRNKMVWAGNGTLIAARRLGWKKIKVVFTDLPEKELRAYAIADNKVGDNSEWDWDILKDDLPEVGDVGFSDDEIAELLGEDDGDEVELTDVDPKPPPKMAWVLIGVPLSQYGDIAEKVESFSLIENAIVEVQLAD